MVLILSLLIFRISMEGLEIGEEVEINNEILKELKVQGDDMIFDTEEISMKNILINESSYVGKKLSTDIRVPGSICNTKYYDYWKNVLKAPEFVLETLRNGYKIPLKQEPPPSFAPNNRSALNDRSFALAELLRLEKLGVISRVVQQPYLVLPLTVVFSKKLRLVVDASRALNPYIEDQKIKLEDLNVAEMTIREGDWQTKSDMDSGYWQLGLHNDHKKYVGLHFVQDDGSLLFWVYNTLFLGVKSAVWIFTKMMLPLKTHLRTVGIRNNFYLDDVRILAKSERLCLEFTQYFWSVCESSGWIINVSKSSDPPTKSMVFLGLVNCSQTMKFWVPEEKIIKIKEGLVKLLAERKPKIRALASVVGKLMSCVKAIGPVVRLLTRFSYQDISKAASWNSSILLSDGTKIELTYILDNLFELNGFAMRASLTLFPVKFSAREVASDASAIGEFVYEIQAPNRVLLSRAFSPSECLESSTFREIQAFEDFYSSSAAEDFRGSDVVHFTDNMNCERILLVGSKNVKLHPKVLKIFLCWKALDIRVSVCFIPREDPRIVFADEGSRTFDLSDYSIDFENMAFLFNTFGPYDIDCFSSKYNKKCEFYFSKFPDPMAAGINFFAQNVANGNLWVFPPVHLIVPTVLHLWANQSRGTLVVPAWFSAHFWNSICDDGKHLNMFVVDFYKFKPVYQSGDWVRSSVFKGVKQFFTLALQFNFSGISKEMVLSSNVNKNFCFFGGCRMCYVD